MPEYRSISLTRLRSDIDSAKLPFIEEKKAGPVRDPDREEALNLTYKKGAKIKDKITGKGGEILAGTRRTVTVSPARSR